MPNSNLEGDLKVEHQNCDFKTGLLNLSGDENKGAKASTKLSIIILGNYTEQSLQRIAKSMEMSKLLKQKLVPHYKDW